MVMIEERLPFSGNQMKRRKLNGSAPLAVVLLIKPSVSTESVEPFLNGMNLVGILKTLHCGSKAPEGSFTRGEQLPVPFFEKTLRFYGPWKDLSIKADPIGLKPLPEPGTRQRISDRRQDLRGFRKKRPAGS